MPKTSDEQKEARREQILAAAQRVFGEHGYEGATVARLERESGLSRGAIFNYFANKDELFLTLAERDAERFGRLWLDTGFTGLLRAILAEDPAWLSVYFEASRRLRTDESYRKRFAARAPEVDRQLEARLEELRASGELRDDVPLETLGRFMGIVADGLALRTAAGFATEDADDLLRLVDEAIRPPARSRTRARRSA